MGIGEAVSLLRDEKGDAGLPDYALDFLPQPSGATSWGTASSLPRGTKVTGCSWP